MPTEIHFTRFNKNLEELAISTLEWNECVEAIDNLRISYHEDQSIKAVECYCKLIEDWTPVFWLSKDGGGSMRQSGFFKFDESYESAITMARFLKAIIHGDEGIILFEPNYGVIYDPYEEDEISITLDDLLEHRVYYANDVQGAINQMLNLKEKLRIQQAEKEETDFVSDRRWWEFWK